MYDLSYFGITLLHTLRTSNILCMYFILFHRVNVNIGKKCNKTVAYNRPSWMLLIIIMKTKAQVTSIEDSNGIMVILYPEMQVAVCYTHKN